MKALISGCKGMLGVSVQKVFSDWDLILTDSIELDVRNIKQVMSYAKQKPDIILHLAAETDHFKAEFNPTDAYLTNHTGTQNMVELARLLDIPIVYIGTAGIFDGEKDLYTEEDQPNPINHYGRSKYYGECAVRLYPKHYILRSGWAMGGGPEIDKKFINKVYKQIMDGAKTLYGITDIYGTPTYTYDFALTMREIIEQSVPYGIYHCSGMGKASRFDVLKAFVECMGISITVKLVPMTYDEYHDKFPLQCPYTKSEVLDISKICKLKVSHMRWWRDALTEYTEQYYD
jgi:dTDP-4-dehydrorhamnose reductase